MVSLIRTDNLDTDAEVECIMNGVLIKRPIGEIRVKSLHKYDIQNFSGRNEVQ